MPFRAFMCILPSSLVDSTFPRSQTQPRHTGARWGMFPNGRALGGFGRCAVPAAPKRQVQEPCALWPLDRAEPLSGCRRNCAGRLVVSEGILCRAGPSILGRRSPTATAEGHTANVDPDWVEDKEDPPMTSGGGGGGGGGAIWPPERGAATPATATTQDGQGAGKAATKPSSKAINQLHYGVSPS